MRSRNLALVAALVACGGSGGAGTTPADHANSELPQLPAVALTAIDKSTHDRARDAARAGRLHEAKRLLGHLAISYPDHEILLAQYNAVGARIEGAQAAAKASLDAAPARTPASPPATTGAGVLVRPARTSYTSIPKLVKRSQTKNGITDDERWFQNHRDLRCRAKGGRALRGARCTARSFRG